MQKPLAKRGLGLGCNSMTHVVYEGCGTTRRMTHVVYEGFGPWL